MLVKTNREALQFCRRISYRLALLSLAALVFSNKAMVLPVCKLKSMIDDASRCISSPWFVVFLLFDLFVWWVGWLVSWLLGGLLRLFVCLFVSLFLCLIVSLFVCLFDCFFVCLFACLFVCLFVCLSLLCVCVFRMVVKLPCCCFYISFDIGKLLVFMCSCCQSWLLCKLQCVQDTSDEAKTLS